MSNWLHKIQHIGVDSGQSKEVKRSIILCNSLSLFVAFTPILFSILLTIASGRAIVTPPLLVQPLIVLSPILLNALKLTTLSRILLSWITPAVILAYSIYNKSRGLDVETSSYVGFRINMVVFSVIPFLLFTPKEKLIMAFSLLLAISFTLGFDPIHALFGVGYADVGLTDRSYFLTNIRALIGIIITGSCALILKNLFENSERANEDLIVQLGEKNEEIESQLQENISQNENIRLQKDLIEKQYSGLLQRETDLIESRNQLALANKIISSQHKLLEKENSDLGEKIVTQNVVLEKANTDLIQMNADLHQFTYMASHNLRGPIATLLGLYNIFPTQKLDVEIGDLVSKSKTALQKLDTVVKDLNQIGKIDNSLLKIKEKVYWEELISTVLNQYHDEIKDYNIQIKVDTVGAPYIMSIRSILYSILNNIVSNAIKFRSPDRDLIIQFSAELVQNKVLLSITDNGLGMNLPYIGDRLFMMYKRFHDHVVGKGLGLFLIKYETEILGGSVFVSSELNHHTTVALEFPVIPIDV